MEILKYLKQPPEQEMQYHLPLKHLTWGSSGSHPKGELGSHLLNLKSFKIFYLYIFSKLGNITLD